MNEKLKQYVGRDITPLLSESMTLQIGKAKESGRDYFYFVIKFKNGFDKMILVDRNMAFPLLNALETADQTQPAQSGIPVPVRHGE